MGRIEPETAASTQPVGLLDKVKVFIKNACTFKRNSAPPDLLADERRSHQLVESGRKMVRDPRDFTRRSSYFTASRQSVQERNSEADVIDFSKNPLPSQISQRRSSSINPEIVTPKVLDESQVIKSTQFGGTKWGAIAAGASQRASPIARSSQVHDLGKRSAFRDAILRPESSGSYVPVEAKVDEKPKADKVHPVKRLIQIYRAVFTKNFPGEVEEKEYRENIRRQAHAKPIAIKKGSPAFRLSSKANVNAFEEFRSINGPSKPRVSNTSETDLFMTERAAVRKVKPNVNPRFSTQVFLDNDQDNDGLTPIQRNFLESVRSRNSDGQNKLQIQNKTGNRDASIPQGGPRPQANQDQSRSSITNNPKLNEIARNYGKGGLEPIKESHESAGSSPNAKEPNNSGNQTAQNRGQQGATGGPIGKGHTQTGLNTSLEPRQNAGVPHKDVRLKAEPENSNSEQLQSGHPGSDDSSQNFLTGTLGVHNSPIKTRNQTSEQPGVRPIVGDSKEEDRRSITPSFGPQGEPTGAAKNAGERPNLGNQQATDGAQTLSTQPAVNPSVSGNASNLQQPQAPANPDSSKNGPPAVKQTEVPAPAAEAKTGFFSMNMSGTAAPNSSIKGMFSSSQPSTFFATKPSDTIPAANPAAVTQQQTPAQPADQPTVTAPVVPAPTIAAEVSTEVKVPAAASGTSFFGGKVGTGLFSGSGLSGTQQTQTNGASTSGTVSAAGFPKPPSPPKQANNPFLQPLGPSTTGESILNNILQKSKDSGMFGPTSGTFGRPSNQNNATTATGFFTGGNSSAGQPTGSSFFNKDSAQGGGSFFNNQNNREQPPNNPSSGGGGGSSFFSGQNSNNNRPSGNVASSFFGAGGGGGDNRGGSSSSFFGGGGNNSSAFQSRVDEERPGPSGGQQSQAASHFFSGSSSGQNRPSVPAGNAFFGSSSGGNSSFFGSNAPSIFQQGGNNGGRAPEYNQHGQQIRRISQKPNQEKFW